MAEDEEPRGVPLSPKSTNPIARPALGVRARPWCESRRAFKKPFRSPKLPSTAWFPRPSRAHPTERLRSH